MASVCSAQSSSSGGSWAPTATLYIEPMAGYTLVNYTSAAASSSYTGPTYSFAAEYALKFGSFSLAPRVDYFSASLANTANTASVTETLAMTGISAGLRLYWGGIFLEGQSLLNAQFKIRTTVAGGNSDGTGSGYLAGVGIEKMLGRSFRVGLGARYRKTDRMDGTSAFVSFGFVLPSTPAPVGGSSAPSSSGG